MTYSGFLISNYSTGLDRELQPWLLPDEAFHELLDGFVYRGILNKRDGYSGFANGLKSTYTESRMVHGASLLSPSAGVIDGVNATFTFNLTGPISRGSLSISDDNPSQSAKDNGRSGFIGNIDPAGPNSIDYTTGVVVITFATPPAIGSLIAATYAVHPGNPVMGIMLFFTAANEKRLLTVDTQYVNIYDPLTDRLVDISPAAAYTGNNTDFFSWVNYPTAADAPRLLFSNRADNIQQFDGTTVTTYTPTFNGGLNPFKARQIFNVRDRLVAFQTVEGGVLYPRRIRISGFGQNCDNFDNSAPGAGFIDIPDNSWFYGAAFNRDDVFFFTEDAAWMLKYTNNDVAPFILEKVDPSRGSRAAFSVLTYLNRTIGASPRGLVVSNGYAVERMDNNIPEFTFNNINSNAFEHCFSGFLDEDRDVYLIYPSLAVDRPNILDLDQSDRILTINFEEDNFATYRIPLSCMGNFVISFTLLWSDLTELNGFPNWDELAAKYGNWNAFPFTKGVPIAIGGGHKGEIWRLNDTQNEDNPQIVRGISIVDAHTIDVTTDWNNYNIGDYINFEAVTGMEELNHKQFAITQIITPYTTFRLTDPTIVFSPYVSGGIASRVTPFEALTKKFNPYTEANAKVRCGWLYLYVTCSETDLENPDDTKVPCFLDIDVITDDTQINTRPAFSYRVDCTNLDIEIGEKKWVKIWINQVAKFIQFRMSNTQAGSSIQVHAMMPGFRPVGRLV